jgi:hypothetical protein
MAVSLWDALEKVHDRRSRQGRRYPLRSVLALSVGAVISGCSSLGAIADWIAEVAKRGLLEQFGIERGRPCHATLHYVFTSLNVRSLERALASWVAGGSEADHIAIDGKTLRGSKFADYSAAHLLAAYCEKLSGVVAQLRLEPGMNEITAVLKLLRSADIRGAVVTGDAMFCQKSVCEAVLAGEGDYVLPVKDNQPELKADIKTALAASASPLGGTHQAA